METITKNKTVAIIGGGPAGLMAAEVIASAGFEVSLYDAMPSVGRKFLLAGVGGMNITHAEQHEKFLDRYNIASKSLTPHLNAFSPSILRDWIHGLGIETFVGSSNRVFPKDMKAAPLLRAWLHRLRELGVRLHPRHKFTVWDNDNNLLLDNPDSTISISADAIVFALGGASWQRLGSDGAWVELFRNKNIDIKTLQPSNCGFEVSWTQKLRDTFSGAQLNTVSLSAITENDSYEHVRGEAIISSYGIEGTTVYALSRMLREQLNKQGSAILNIDLLPDVSLKKINELLSRPRGKNSQSNFLRKQLNLPPVKLALLHELLSKEKFENKEQLASAIKCLPITLTAMRPIDEAISCAGGIAFSELSTSLMINKMPGVFCAGEMLDWEAPTGGYLLSACFATGRAAGLGVIDYLNAGEFKNVR